MMKKYRGERGMSLPAQVVFFDSATFSLSCPLCLSCAKDLVKTWAATIILIVDYFLD